MKLRSRDELAWFWKFIRKSMKLNLPCKDKSLIHFFFSILYLNVIIAVWLRNTAYHICTGVTKWFLCIHKSNVNTWTRTRQYYRRIFFTYFLTFMYKTTPWVLLKYTSARKWNHRRTTKCNFLIRFIPFDKLQIH